MKKFSIIVAMDEARGIGKKGALAWHLPADLKHFKEITCTVSDPSKQNAVVMGRKTWESLPLKFRPLPGRLNVVLTHQKDLDLFKGGEVFEEFNQMLAVLSQRVDIERIFVIGGAQVYAFAIQHPACERIFVTQILGFHDCDAFFPSLPDRFKLSFTGSLLTEKDQKYQFIEQAVV